MLAEGEINSRRPKRALPFVLLLLFFLDSAYSFNSSGTIRNLTVSVFEDYSGIVEKHGPLKFNISWKAPATIQKPSSYSIFITSLNKTDYGSGDSCPEEALFHTTRADATCCQILLPENQYYSDAPELNIRPTCSYSIQIFANPRGDPRIQPPEVRFTVPECVGRWCNCEKAENDLPVPEVDVLSSYNLSDIRIKWHVASVDSRVKSYVISFGIPILISNNRLPVYNITKLESVPWTVSSYIWSGKNTRRFDITRGGKIFVAAQDNIGCLGKPGTTLIDSRVEPVSSGQWTDRDSKFRWTLWIPLIGMILMLFFGSVIGLHLARNKNKDNYCWRYCRAAPRIDELIRLSGIRAAWLDSTLQERNVLYVEREIQIAREEDGADDLEVSHEKLMFIRELGKGQFGKVYLGTLESHGERAVAIKISNGWEDGGKGAREEFLGEIETMKNAGEHPHLVKLIGICTVPSRPICLILEYLEGGDLLAYLHRLRDRLDDTLDSGIISLPRSRRTSFSETTYTMLREHSPGYNPMDREDSAESSSLAYIADCHSGDIDESRFVKFALDIARGMEHLESKAIIHRDLAARNILLTANLTLKISDFGLSRNDGLYIIGNNGGGPTRRLPVRWMALEALRDRKFTSKSDVWSFAVVLWEIGTLGAFPYENIQDDQLLRHVLRDEARLERPENVSRELYDLMRACWSSRPQNRPTFSEIVPRLCHLGASFCATSNPCYDFLMPTVTSTEVPTIINATS